MSITTPVSFPFTSAVTITGAITITATSTITGECHAAALTSSVQCFSRGRQPSARRMTLSNDAAVHLNGCGLIPFVDERRNGQPAN
jgi:hypothetical protein